MSLSRRTRWCWLLIITLLGAFLRLYRIGSLPPSAGFDQAAYGVDALGILQGERPIFMPSNMGREALFSYLVAVAFWLMGGATAIYVTSALVGVLTIPAVYLAADEMFHTEDKPLKQLGGLVAAAVTALSYWHLSWSRLGMRAILVPLFASLTLYLLWRGLRTGERWAFAGSGLFLGLGLYTYQAERILPLIVLCAFAYRWWWQRSLSRRDLANLLLVLAVVAIVFAPLGHYFLTHPGSSGQRLRQTLVVDTAQGILDNARTLLSRVGETFLAIVVRGDADPRVNAPGRAALNPFLSLALLLGVGVSIWRFRRPVYPLLLTWLVAMGVPAVLAQYGAATKRALGAMPAAAMLAAVGLLGAWEPLGKWVARRRPAWGKAARVGWALLIGLGLLYGGIRAYHDYFVVWGRDPNLFTHFEAGVSAIGAYIGELDSEGPVYVSPVPADHPSIVLRSGQRTGIKTYHGQFCLVVPLPQAAKTIYVFVPAEDKNSLGLLEAVFPQGQVVAEGPLHYGLPYFLSYGVPQGAEAQVAPSHELVVNWDDKISLLGFDIDPQTTGTPPALKPGEAVQLTLYYQVLGSMKRDYTAFVQLIGAYNPATDGPLWAQDDSEPCRGRYRTSVWETGEVVIDHAVLGIPAEALAGEYQVVMGLYHWQTLERLPVLDAAGEVTGDHAILFPLQVAAR